MANTPPSSDLFASLISDIKTYSGTDPLLPWLRGIRKLRDSLPAQLLSEKLPRFLQKCAQNFQSDRRYQNDLRYVRVWLQLMDFVDDPKALLRTMENNRIGMKKALFYQAYALYYEKSKKFEEAEKMYHLGVQNLAEPNGELQKSYEQFLHRLKRHKNKRVQCPERKTAKIPLSSKSTSHHVSKSEENNENICLFEGTVPENLSGVRNVRSRKEREECPRIVKPLMEANRPSKDLRNADSSIKMEHIIKVVDRSTAKKAMPNERGLDEHKMFHGDDTVVVKFVDTAVVGKSEAEDACHHGLVDPTINMKEAMDAINSMFREPIETAPVGRRSHRNQPKECNSSNNGFEVFIDEDLDKGIESTDEKEGKGFPLVQGTDTRQPHQEPFQIFIDGEDSDENDNVGQSEVQNAFVLACPRDDSPESSDDQGVESSRPRLRREDTVVRRFVGSAIADAPEVENVCHHGLVEPTVNLKEAMDDINNMFGKPIDFVRSKRSRKQDAPPPPSKGDFGGFSILPDDDMEPQPNKPLPKKSNKSRENDLFEPTVFTKEAMDDINKLFGMPLDF